MNLRGGSLPVLTGLVFCLSYFTPLNFCQRVLLYLYARGEGYAREIARFFNTDLSPIQRSLEKYEFNGILVSRLAGRTRLYSFNPRYAFKPELENLLKKASLLQN